MASSGSSGASVCSMSTASTKATLSGFANYDVLLSFDEENGKLCLDSTQHHVGNHRFKVLLDIHRNEFVNNRREGNDTSPIIEKMIGIVTKECVPAGRFLQPPRAKIGSNGKDEEVEELDNDDATLRWNPVPEQEVVKFIERSLMPAEEESSNNHNHYHDDMPPPGEIESHNIPHEENADKVPARGAAPAAAPASAANPRVSFVDMEPLPLPFNHNDPLGSGLAPPQTADPPFPPPPPPSSSSAADDEKKRRRRSSLLRRSVSDQIVAVVQNLDVKKKMNRTTEERRPSLWRLFGKNKIVSQPEPLDVIFTHPQSTGVASSPDAVELAQNHTGNNRLQVMMEMERDKYSRSSIDDQAKMLKHWLEVVANFWKGRFLLEKHEEDPLLEEIVASYHVLDAGQAEKALETIMSKLVARAEEGGNTFNSPLGTLFEGGSIESFQPSEEFTEKELEPSLDFSVPRPIHRDDAMRRSQSESAVGRQQPAQRRRSRFAIPNFGRNPAADTSSFSSGASSSGSSSARPQNVQRTASVPVSSGPRPQGVRRTSSESTSASSLPEPPRGLENMQGMRSAAVESLQRRKKRQGLASRIQKMAETTLRRNSSIASVASNSDRTSASGTSQNFMSRLGGSFRRSSSGSRDSRASNVSMPPTDIPTTLNAPVAANARRPSYMSTSSSSTSNSKASRGSIMGRFVSAVPRNMGGSERRESHMSASSISTMGDGSSRNMGPADNFISGEIVFENGDAMKSGHLFNDGSTDFRPSQS